MAANRVRTMSRPRQQPLPLVPGCPGPPLHDRVVEMTPHDSRRADVSRASTIGRDPRSGVRCRHHLHEDAACRHIREAAVASGVTKRATSHPFHHAPDRARLRHQHCTGTLWPLRRSDHDDVRTRPWPRRTAVTSPADRRAGQRRALSCAG